MMPKTSNSSGRSSVRALDIVRAFQIACRPLSLSELSEQTGIPISTCHGVVKLLAREGYLYFPVGRQAYPTRRLHEMAGDIARHDPLITVMEPTLRGLREDVDETVILGMRHDDDSVVYLLVLESGQAIRYSSKVGERKPLHSSAIGKVVLSSLPTEELDAWLRSHTLERITRNTITKEAALRRDLDATTSRRYSLTRGENVEDVMALAAPVVFGTTKLAVAVAGPMTRLASSEQRLARRLLQATRAIEHSLDGRASERHAA